MNISIQEPNAVLSFGNTVTPGAFASLTGVGSGITRIGLRMAGAVELSSSSATTKKGVTRALVQCRVPIFDLKTSSDNYQWARSVAGKPSAGYAQVQLTVTLPNTAGIVSTDNDFGADGVPQTQAAANAVAVGLGTQVVLNTICNQAEDGVLAPGKSLMDYNLLGTDVDKNPIARGLMGLTPLSESDYAIKPASL